MPLRSTLGAVVLRVPYSDRLPQVVKTVFLEKIEQNPPETGQDIAPIDKIHSRLMDSRLQDAEKPEVVDEDDTVRDTESVSLRKSVMQQYLDEQNAKFDTLINRNLGEVLQQQNRYEDEAGWRSLVLDLATARNTLDVTKSVSLLLLRALKSVYSYVPFTDRTQPLSPARSPRAANTELAFRETVHEHVSTQYLPGLVSFGTLMENMDYNEKVLLLRRLHQELGISYDLDLARYPHGRPVLSDTPLAEKIETMMILLIRLAFIGFRLFVPVTTALYHKFINNQLMVFNNRNFNRFLNKVIHTMESVEELLDFETGRKKDGTAFTSDDAMEYLGEFKHQIPGSDSWAATIARHTFSRYTKEYAGPPDYATDPRYAQYFTERRRRQDDSDDDIFLEAVEHPSVFQVAREFADQMT